MAAHLNDDKVAPVAGRYVIEDLLGRGGMGAVYRVRDLRGGQRLALKRGFARDGRKLEKRRALLEREYHTLAQLAHPRIIEVYDYGVDEAGPYYTMELLDGADLDNRGKMPWREACVLLCDVASSLAILHSRGLLHRDVSARNVRCTADGRAKLLDFGAMTCVGVAKEVLGTPPYVAPEALQMQALDARADLFSLGALAYYLLTGRHAFGVRRLHELRDAWRSPPHTPARFAQDIPPALCTLVLQLLSLDRNARPQSAGEVMERLCAIAGLPLEDRVDISRAYLSMPTLVGRDVALATARRRILMLVRGDGGSVLVEGVEGSGRSRLLDACVLDGKLLGATVLRADASDSATGEWGVARVLGGQLVEALPQAAMLAARLSRHVLGCVIESLRADTSSVQPPPDRSLLLRELRDFMLALSIDHNLLVVVDDVDRIDEPSAALLAALAHKTDRNALLVIVSASRDSLLEPTPSLKLLRTAATPISIEPLEADQTEALMRAVFGEAKDLSLVAGRIHALSHGNPRATMELAQHLVDRGLARYQAGTWSLPSKLDEAELPSTMTASLHARLLGLSEDARELCEVLCLADGDPLTLGDYAALTEHRDGRRVYRALDTLCAARILLAEVERYRFVQRGFLAVLNETMSEAHRKGIHLRLGGHLRAHGGDPHRVAHHLLLGGHEREAVELLVNDQLMLDLPPLPLLERLLAASVRQALPARFTHHLRNAVLTKAPMVMADETFRRELPALLAQLRRDSGLDDYDALADVPESERLTQALIRAEARFAAMPSADRVCAPFDAIRQLARFSGNFCSIGIQLYDLEFLDSLPSLEPLMPLSPALAVLRDLTEGCKESLRGRVTHAVHIYYTVLRRIDETGGAGLDAAQLRGVRCALHYLLGLVKASMGISSAEEHAVVLEADREHRINAWRVRVALHLNQGNAEQARKCQRRAELLQLQEGVEQRYVGTSAGFELVAHALAGDLLGVKRALDAVSVLGEHYSGWKPGRLLGLCHYRWLQGDLAGALDAIEQALPITLAGRHPYYCYVVSAHIALLNALDRRDEALARGREYLAICEREGLTPTDRWVQNTFAQVLTQCGEHAEALLLIDKAIAEAERLGMAGLVLGTLYETKARTALGMGDRATFDKFAECCAREYRKGRNPVLSARFARLLDEAREADRTDVGELPEQAGLFARSDTEGGFDTINSRMLECVDPSDRARCALAILLQSTSSVGGYLFGVNAKGELISLAALPDEPPGEGLEAWLQAKLLEEVESSMGATASAEEHDVTADSALPTRFTDAAGRIYEPVFLGVSGELSDDQQCIAAVLAVQVPPGPRAVMPRELLTEIAEQLLEHGDVQGIHF